jgi:hypothetical protein
MSKPAVAPSWIPVGLSEDALYLLMSQISTPAGEDGEYNAEQAFEGLKSLAIMAENLELQLLERSKLVSEAEMREGNLEDQLMLSGMEMRKMKYEMSMEIENLKERLLEAKGISEETKREYNHCKNLLLERIGELEAARKENDLLKDRIRAMESLQLENDKIALRLKDTEARLAQDKAENTDLKDVLGMTGE